MIAGKERRKRGWLPMKSNREMEGEGERLGQLVKSGMEMGVRQTRRGRGKAGHEREREREGQEEREGGQAGDNRERQIREKLREGSL